MNSNQTLVWEEATHMLAIGLVTGEWTLVIMKNTKCKNTAYTYVMTMISKAATQFKYKPLSK